MQITDLSPRDNTKQFDLYVDHKFLGVIGLGVVAKFNLYIDKEVDEDLLEDIFIEDLVIKFTDKLINILSHGLRPIFYAKQKLIAFFKDTTLSDEQRLVVEGRVLSKLAEYGYLDDRKYITEFVSSRIRNRPRSKFFIKQELLKKGLDGKDIDEVFSKMEINDLEIILKLLNKKYKGDPIDSEDIKIIRFLKGKGFSWDIIKNGINKYNNDDIR